MEKLMTDIAISSGDNDSAAPGTKGAAGGAAVAGAGGRTAAGADVGRITRVGVPIGSEGSSGTSGDGTEGGAGAGEKERDVVGLQTFIFMVACGSGGGHGGRCTPSLVNITRHIYFPFPIYPAVPSLCVGAGAPARPGGADIEAHDV